MVPYFGLLLIHIFLKCPVLLSMFCEILLGLYRPLFKNGSADIGAYSGTRNEKNFIEKYEIVRLLSCDFVRVVENPNINFIFKIKIWNFVLEQGRVNNFVIMSLHLNVAGQIQVKYAKSKLIIYPLRAGDGSWVECCSPLCSRDKSILNQGCQVQKMKRQNSAISSLKKVKSEKMKKGQIKAKCSSKICYSITRTKF